MTFTNIAIKNVCKKLGGYLVYFFSTAFSVVIFNLFCSMYYNPSFEAYRFGTGKITVLFRGSAIAVLLFASVFVLYSGSYFIKIQKKEIAIYSLLGMRKEKIAVMMFLETFFIGLLAVACGTLIGTLSAGYFTSLLMRFMAVGTLVVFLVKPQAIATTVIAFLLLFVISGIRAYRTIYKFNLIDLLSAFRQSEGVPGYSLLGAAAGLILLGVGYITSAVMNLNVGGMKLLFPAFAVIIFVASGTYLLFRNFVPMVISVMKRNRPFYYRTSNFISVSQIAFRLKANSKMLAVVSLLCATTITMISASYSLYKGLEDTTDFYAPFSYLCKGITAEQHEAILKAVSEIGEVEITADDKIDLINVRIQSPDYAVQDDKNGSSNLGEEMDAYLLSESMYLKIITDTQAVIGKYANNQTSFTGGLRDKECYFVDGNASDKSCAGLIGTTMSIMMEGMNTKYTITGSALHKYIGLLDLYQHPTVVVSDKVYQNYLLQTSESDIDTFYGFMFDDEMASGNTVAAIDRIVPARFGNGGLPGNVSYIGMYKANFALYGSYIFIGLFIGILFMLAVGSVMYYKLIMEAQEEVPRYEILRKSGMKKGEILFSVVKQLGLVYGLPLFVGLIHTMFALLTYNRMLELMGKETPTLLNAVKVVLIFVLVYGVFYGFSVQSYQSIVWNQGNGGKA